MKVRGMDSKNHLVILVSVILLFLLGLPGVSSQEGYCFAYLRLFYTVKAVSSDDTSIDSKFQEFPYFREDDFLVIDRLEAYNAGDCPSPPGMITLNLEAEDGESGLLCRINLDSIAPNESIVMNETVMRQPNQYYTSGVTWECIERLEKPGRWNIILDSEWGWENATVHITQTLVHEQKPYIPWVKVRNREWYEEREQELKLFSLSAKIAVISSLIGVIAGALITMLIQKWTKRNEQREALEALHYELEYHSSFANSILNREQEYFEERSSPTNDFHTLNLQRILTGRYIEDVKLTRDLTVYFSKLEALNNLLVIIRKGGNRSAWTNNYQRFFSVIKEYLVPESLRLGEEVQKYRWKHLWTFRQKLLGVNSLSPSS